jgi:hypothetical protein
MTAPAAAYSFPTASKQTNKQTNISLDSSNPVKEENTQTSLAIPQILSSFFAHNPRVPIPTKLTPKYKLRICAATT